MRALPSGVVTFLFSDIVDSTALWEEHPDAMAEAVVRQDTLLRAAVEDHGGVPIKSTGDGLMAAFGDAGSGVEAAVDAQRALAREDWPVSVAVRMGLHAGPADAQAGDYRSSTVNRAARVASAAHPGQILVSAATAELAGGSTFQDLGDHHLKGLPPLRLFQVVAPGLRHEFPPLATAALTADLPSPPTAFVGRDAELDVLRRLVGEHRLVTLTGMGGCGKTRLAIESARQLAGDFLDGVRFVDLAAVSDEVHVLDAVVRALGLADDPTGADPATRVSGYLADRSILCILDNCEHLLAVCATLAEVVIARPGPSRLLATSREPLGVVGEQVYVVPSLDIDTEGVRLFTDRAAEARARFAFDDSNRATIAGICRRLDGIPLAIELAAARVAHLSTAQLLERLDDRFHLLAGGPRRVERHQTLAATLDWSHDLLAADEQVVLRRLAAFPASFSLEAAEAVVGAADVVSQLGSLVAKSLVQVVDDGEVLRYRLLETVRLYAETKLVAAGEAESCRARHRDWLLDWLESIPLEERWFGDVDVLTSEHPNVRAALEWSSARGDDEAVARIAAGVDWARGDYWREGKRWCEEVAAAADRLPRGLQVQLYVMLWRLTGMATGGLADWAAADRLAQQAIDTSCGEPSPLHAMALAQRGSGAAVSATELRDESFADRATASVDAGVAMSERFSVPWRMFCRLLAGNTYSTLALRWPRNFELAEDQYVAGIAAASAAPPYLGLRAMLCGHLALHRVVSGDTRGALALVRDGLLDEALSPVLRQADPMALALAVALGGTKDFDAARRELRAYAESARRADFALGPETVAVFGGVLAALREDWETAARLFAAGERSVYRSPVASLLYFRFRDRVRDALGSQRSRELRAEGRAMPLTDAVAAALR